MKKLLAILAATAVLASATLVTTSTLAMTADAACTVTIFNSVDGENVSQSYAFYQIFGGTVTTSASGNNSAGEMEDIVWGSAISDGSAFISALKTAFSGTFDNCTTAAAVAEAIKNNFTSTAQIDKLAAAIANYVTTSSATAVITTTSDGVTSATIKNSGYYLIVDNSTSSRSALGDTKADEYDISKHMLAVINADNAEEPTMDIVTKNEKPSLVKKVCENSATTDSSLSYDNDGGYNDIADYCIGDEVPFKLYATLPSTFDGFDSYYLCFHDQLGSEFDFDDTSVKVTLRVGTPESHTDYTIDSGYTVSTSTTDQCTFEVAFSDVLGISLSTLTDSDGKAISYNTWEDVAGAGAEIIVSYKATLTADAVIGLNGQENQACLEYSNNANNEASGDSHEENTGFTPWDKVIVFTYELDIDKVSSADGSLLAGAQFTLTNEDDKYAVLSESNGVYTLTGWDSSSGTMIKTTGATVVIKGLDDGIYTLTETQAPSGYNNDSQNTWTLIIASDHDKNSEGNQNGQQEWDEVASDALVSLTLTGDDSGSTVTGAVDTGIVTATIKNTSGATLPTTGGIGTTIFYVAGGVLVVGAGVLLISRKRSRS